MQLDAGDEYPHVEGGSILRRRHYGAAKGKVMNDKKDKSNRTWTEEIEIAGGQLIEQVKSLIAEGNVRELRVKAAGGQVIFETPVTVGVLAGGAVALAAPWLAILGAIAALVARVKVEVVREEPVAKPARKPRAAKAKSAAGGRAGSGGKAKRAAAGRTRSRAGTSRRRT